MYDSYFTICNVYDEILSHKLKKCTRCTAYVYIILPIYSSSRKFYHQLSGRPIQWVAGVFLHLYFMYWSKTYCSHEEMTQLTYSRLVTFVYLKFTQMLILKVV